MDMAKTVKKSLNILKKNANDFEITRNNVLVGSVKASICDKDYPNTIQTYEDTKILDGDCLSFFGKKYYIINAEPQVHNNELCYYMLKYSTNPDYQESVVNQHSEVHNYNINAPLTGTNLIGAQHGFTLNVDNSIKYIQKVIDDKTEDKEALQELLNEIKEASESSKPLTKGIFAKFSDLLSKHSDVAIAVGTFFTTLFFGK